MKKGIISVVTLVAGVVLGVTVASGMARKKKTSIQNKSDKHEALMMLFNQWMISKQEGKSVVDYFHMKDIHTIAIYGLSFVGKRLKDELNGSDIEVKYAIDKNADNIFSDIDVIFPSDGMPDVDAIIVTPVFFYEQIKEELEQLTQTPIISMNDILYEV